MSHALRPRVLGFTLIEVMVALGMVAVVLLAGMQSAAMLTRNAQRQSDAFLAQLCADNELIKFRLSQQLPGVGDSAVACDQAGREFQVQLGVRPTPNPNFRRIVAQVMREDVPVYQVSTVLGRR